MKIQHFLVGGKYGNPALLRTSINPVNFSQGVGVCIRSISYGSVTSEKLTMVVKISETGEKLNVPMSNFGLRNRLEIARHLVSTLTNCLESLELNDKENTGITVGRLEEATKYKFFVGGLEILSLPLLLDASYESENGWTFSNATLNKSTYVDVETSDIGFIYLNVVENSFINGYASRIAAVFPINFIDGTNNGYNYFEWNNPNYINLDVNQFSFLEVQIRNKKGKLIPFSSEYDTVVQLEFVDL